MKKTEVVLIVILAILAIVAVVVGFSMYLASNNITQTTPGYYFVVLDIEGVNNLPPRLTQVVMRYNALEETYSANPFPIEEQTFGEVLTNMSGIIEVICDDYSESQEFFLQSDREGSALEQRVIFRNLPPESHCIVSANVRECHSSLFSSCRMDDKFLIFDLPA